MAISLSKGNIDWSSLRKNKREWILLFAIGVPLSMIFNYWLFSADIDQFDFGTRLRYTFLLLGYSTTWGFTFGLAGGITSFKADFVEQFVMTIIGAYVLAIVMSLNPSVMNISIFSIIDLLFAFPILICVGFIIGYFINHQIDQRVIHTKDKEVEKSGYIDYRSID